MIYKREPCCCYMSARFSVESIVAHYSLTPVISLLVLNICAWLKLLCATDQALSQQVSTASYQIIVKVTKTHL